MRVVMKAYHNIPDGPELKPGDIYSDWDEAEAARQISIGGARALTAAEVEAEAEAAAAAADKAAADARARADAEAAAKAAKK